MGWEPEENCRRRNYIYSLQQPGGRAHVRNEGLIIIWRGQAVLVHLYCCCLFPGSRGQMLNQELCMLSTRIQHPSESRAENIDS